MLFLGEKRACTEAEIQAYSEAEKEMKILSLDESQNLLTLEASSNFLIEQFKQDNIGPESSNRRSGRENFPAAYKLSLSEVTDEYVAHQNSEFQTSICRWKEFNVPLYGSPAHSKILNDFAPELREKLPLAEILKGNPHFLKNQDQNRPPFKQLDKLSVDYAENPSSETLWLEPSVEMHVDEVKALAIFLGAVGARSDAVQFLNQPSAEGYVKIVIHSDILKLNKVRLHKLLTDLTDSESNIYQLTSGQQQRALFLYEKTLRQLMDPSHLGVAPEPLSNLNHLELYPDTFWFPYTAKEAIPQIQEIEKELKTLHGLADLARVGVAPGDDYIAGHNGALPPAGMPDHEALALTLREIAVWVWVERVFGLTASDEGIHLGESAKGLPIFAALYEKFTTINPDRPITIGIRRDVHLSLWKSKLHQLINHFEFTHNDRLKLRAEFIDARFTTLLHRLRDDGWAYKIHDQTANAIGWWSGHMPGEVVKLGVTFALGYLYHKFKGKPPSDGGGSSSGGRFLAWLPASVSLLSFLTPKKAPKAASETSDDQSTHSQRRMSELFGIRSRQVIETGGHLALWGAATLAGLAVASRWISRGGRLATGTGGVLAGLAVYAIGEGTAYASAAGAEALSQPQVSVVAELISVEEARRNGEEIQPLSETNSILADVVDQNAQAVAETLISGVKIAKSFYEATSAPIQKRLLSFTQ